MDDCTTGISRAPCHLPQETQRLELGTARERGLAPRRASRETGACIAWRRKRARKAKLEVPDAALWVVWAVAIREKWKRTYELFLRDLEEDLEMCSTVNLYRADTNEIRKG